MSAFRARGSAIWSQAWRPDKSPEPLPGQAHSTAAAGDCSRLSGAFAKQIEIVGTTAGLYVVAWSNSICSRDEQRFAEAARNRDIGIYPITRLFSSPIEQRAGYNFGCASMSVDEEPAQWSG
jgi:hypothetical protein